VERWLPGDGIQVHALDWGGPEDGPLVLFLHGIGGNAWIWDDVAPRLRVALQDHHLVAIDQRDGGETDHPPTGYGLERFVADLVAVHDALGGRPMTLVGHSRGGWLAAAFADAHPDRLECLVLVDPARLVFASASDAATFYGWVQDGLGPFDDEASAVAAARANDPEAAWTPVRIRSFLAGLMGGPDGRLVGRLPIAVLPELQAARASGVAVTEGLARLALPVLLLIATRQSAARIADKLAYAERIPGARVVRLPGTHFLHTDCPVEVAAEIASFVRAG